MAKSNYNNLTLSFLVAFISLLVLLTVVVSLPDAAPNDVVSTTCPKTRNSSLCFSVLKSAGSTDPVTLDYYVLNLTHNIAVDTRLLAKPLAAATTNPLLKRRYSHCLDAFEMTVRVMERGKDELDNQFFIVLRDYIGEVVWEIERCLDDFKNPPSEPSSIPMKAKNLLDIVDIAAALTFVLSGDGF